MVQCNAEVYGVITLDLKTRGPRDKLIKFFFLFYIIQGSPRAKQMNRKKFNCCPFKDE